MDLLLLNLKLLGWFHHDLSQLVEYVKTVSRATKVAIPVNYPLSGSDAFRTATGVHAAAIIKARTKGDAWLADRVYRACRRRVRARAGDRGRHMSGMSNVKYWLSQRGLEVTTTSCSACCRRQGLVVDADRERDLEVVKPVKKKAPRRRLRRETAWRTRSASTG